jgi:predicted DNA-binding WGR domain protein
MNKRKKKNTPKYKWNYVIYLGDPCHRRWGHINGTKAMGLKYFKEELMKIKKFNQKYIKGYGDNHDAHAYYCWLTKEEPNFFIKEKLLEVKNWEQVEEKRKINKEKLDTKYQEKITARKNKFKPGFIIKLKNNRRMKSWNVDTTIEYKCMGLNKLNEIITYPYTPYISEEDIKLIKTQ